MVGTVELGNTQEDWDMMEHAGSLRCEDGVWYEQLSDGRWVVAEDVITFGCWAA